MVTTQLLGRDFLSHGDNVGGFELLEIVGDLVRLGPGE